MKNSLLIVLKHTFPRLLGMGLNVYLILLFLKLWRSPQHSDVELIADLTIMIFFEFIMLWAGFFVSIAAEKSNIVKWFCILLFIPLVLGFNAVITGNKILFIYGMVVLFRILTSIFEKKSSLSDNSHTKELSFSNIILYDKLAMPLITFALYAFLLTATVSTEYGDYSIPEFGLTEEFLKNSGYYHHMKMEVEVPHLYLCLGVLYFSVLILLDCLVIYLSYKEEKRKE